MTRPSSRAESISTIWSSAEVPFIFDGGSYNGAETETEGANATPTRHVGGSATPPPMPDAFHVPSDSSPPWLSRLSPAKSSPSKYKKRPPALHLTSSGSHHLLHAVASSEQTSNQDTVSASPSNGVPSWLVVDPSRPQIFDPAYNLQTHPAWGEAVPSPSISPCHKGGRDMELEQSNLLIQDDNALVNARQAGSCGSVETSSQESDSGGVRTPDGISLPPAPYHGKHYMDQISGAVIPGDEEASHGAAQGLHQLGMRTASMPKLPRSSRGIPSEESRPKQHRGTDPSSSGPTIPKVLLAEPGLAPPQDMRPRSRTLGSLDRPHTTGRAPGPVRCGHVKAAGLQRSIDLGETTRRMGTPTAIPYQFVDRPSHLSPTEISFCSESLTGEPRTPRTPRSATLRPKSQGGWASYLSGGLTLRIDQEGAGSYCVNMQYLSYDPFGRPDSLSAQDEGSRPPTPRRPKSRGSKDEQEDCTGILHFVPSGEVKSLVFRSAPGVSCPVLRHLSVADDHKSDLLSREASLTLGDNGALEAAGQERKGRQAWRFVYEVNDMADDTVTANKSVKLLKPITFACSATLLDPEKARKSRLLKLVKKQIGTQIVATPLPPTSTTAAEGGCSGLSLSERDVQSAASFRGFQPPSPWRGSTPSSIDHRDSTDQNKTTKTSGARESSISAESLAGHPAPSVTASAATSGSLLPFRMARSKISKASLRQAARHQAELPPVPASQHVSLVRSGELERPRTASELVKDAYRERAAALPTGYRPDSSGDVDVQARRRRLKTADSAIVSNQQGDTDAKVRYPQTPPRRSRPQTVQEAASDHAPLLRTNYSPACV